jgi:benzaldehyde dehydrogenase (NAD)
MIDLFINGQTQIAEHNATFKRLNASTGLVASVAAAASVSDAVGAVQAAANAFPAWSSLGPGARRAILLKAAHELEQRQGDFAIAMAAETGASAMWAGFNVHLAANMLIEAACLTTQVGGEVIPSDIPGNIAMGLRVPAGVVLGIAPWNAPVILAVRAIAVPLACGNTVVLKSSEICPATHRLIADAFAAAGLPPGVLNCISNAPTDAPQIVEAMITHPAVKRVNFTGSTQVGRLIAMTCAKYLKPVVLELGGKAPMIVLKNANIGNAVAATAFGAFANSGQICMSTERIIVDEAIADEFVLQLKAKVLAISASNHVLGPVIDYASVERCNRLLADALSKGATLVCGGHSTSVQMQATLLDRVTPDMHIFSEESFGPIKPIVRVSGEAAAIACANDNAYGLSASVFSDDIAQAWRVASSIESGICHINGPTVHDEAQMPFGGVKASGFGRFGGKAGIEAFTELRWLTLQTTPRHYPF